MGGRRQPRRAPLWGNGAAMTLTPETLHQCLWARPHPAALASLRHWATVPRMHARPGRREHNFTPIFCLPAGGPPPWLRGRFARPQRQKEILALAVIQVQVSFCAPLAVWGEARLQLSAQGYAYTPLGLAQVGRVTTPELSEVAAAVRVELSAAGLDCPSPEALAQPLPEVLRAPGRTTTFEALFIKDDYPY